MKPTIPNEVADVIEMVRKEESNWPNEWIIECWFMQRGSDDLVRTIRKISLDLLMAALVNGYERELTEEQRHQKVRDLLVGLDDVSLSFEFKDAYHRGVIQTLHALNIDIKGVNA
ncbi:hypothetical protein M5X06_12620 [Paenibacillus alvei]|uniref:Phage protein n=1 Tax=Paenibacillus alvei TaxID=44250 RepID=A0ABT4GUV7_PAEAL|nr:hypothetical protein [Paenibacillus alvei]MCY9760363.1 hypothetical protein [Paenibacillus alvei]MCY9767655.1 hypothetical protein [Paenibacillus alvei]